MRKIDHIARLPDEVLAMISLIPEKSANEKVWVDLPRHQVHVHDVAAVTNSWRRELNWVTVYSLKDLSVVRSYETWRS